MGRRIKYRPVTAPPTAEPKLNQPFFTTQTIIIIAAVWMIIVAAIVGVGYFLMQNRNFQTEFAPLLAVCQSRAANVNSTYTPSSGIHPTITVKSDSEESQLSTAFIPRSARAQSLAETQVVLCIKEAELIFIEQCPYGDRRIEHRIYRYYYVQEAELKEAKTGRTITAHTFSGSAPRTCKETEYFREDEEVTTLKGAPIAAAQVQKWVQSHVIVR